MKNEETWWLSDHEFGATLYHRRSIGGVTGGHFACEQLLRKALLADTFAGQRL